jgi:AbiJ N-terminal domain 5/Abortive infection C-terminus
MRAEANRDQIILAVVKAVEATFGRSEWMELGLLTGTLEYIREHPRLLRSLDWNDPDYHARVIEAVPVVLRGPSRRTSRDGGAGTTPYAMLTNLEVVEKFLNLRAWLQKHDSALYSSLYAGDEDVVVDELQAAAARLEIQDVDAHAARIRRGLREDPAQAIGSSKELLETVLKALLGLHGSGPETRVDVSKLVKDASVQLGLDAGGHRGDEPGAEQRRRLFSALSNIVYATAELRNAGFGTGHGGSQRPALDVATARLVVSSAVALATFYIEAAAAQDQNDATEGSL